MIEIKSKRNIDGDSFDDDFKHKSLKRSSSTVTESGKFNSKEIQTSSSFSGKIDNKEFLPTASTSAIPRNKRKKGGKKKKKKKKGEKKKTIKSSSSSSNLISSSSLNAILTSIQAIEVSGIDELIIKMSNKLISNFNDFFYSFPNYKQIKMFLDILLSKFETLEKPNPNNCNNGMYDNYNGNYDENNNNNNNNNNKNSNRNNNNKKFTNKILLQIKKTSIGQFLRIFFSQFLSQKTLEEINEILSNSTKNNLIIKKIFYEFKQEKKKSLYNKDLNYLILVIYFLLTKNDIYNMKTPNLIEELSKELLGISLNLGICELIMNILISISIELFYLDNLFFKKFDLLYYFILNFLIKYSKKYIFEVISPIIFEICKIKTKINNNNQNDNLILVNYFTKFLKLIIYSEKQLPNAYTHIINYINNKLITRFPYKHLYNINTLIFPKYISLLIENPVKYQIITTLKLDKKKKLNLRKFSNFFQVILLNPKSDNLNEQFDSLFNGNYKNKKHIKNNNKNQNKKKKKLNKRKENNKNRDHDYKKLNKNEINDFFKIEINNLLPVYNKFVKSFLKMEKKTLSFNYKPSNYLLDQKLINENNINHFIEHLLPHMNNILQ
ncbi:nnp-1 protein putative nuclear protein 1 nop52 [Anaeramoeba flamelloides]|uniref:Nnp-1 protein putative nuclear protein 1 nop52 n=1 Tax=Anaeramoeba flamelloides TaxID=1746091 RepID=A0AAV7Y6N7_9EUKA|nr:nnp-1 protein putative nuclear protein 1 nop52 [Anaeramoeba flamelloides]